MKYIRTSSLKRLFSLNKRHSFDEEIPTKDCEFVHEISSKENLQRPTWKCFSYQEIFDATNGFSPGTYIYIHFFFSKKIVSCLMGCLFLSIFVAENMVGKGGYAEVYRGILSEDGQAIAVKVLTRLGSSSSNDSERKEKEFLTEIGTLGHVCHRNVTALLGCCIDNGLYLIFQFSSKGSVASVLHGIICLSLNLSDLFISIERKRNDFYHFQMTNLRPWTGKQGIRLQLEQPKVFIICTKAVPEELFIETSKLQMFY